MRRLLTIFSLVLFFLAACTPAAPTPVPTQTSPPNATSDVSVPQSQTLPPGVEVTSEVPPAGTLVIRDNSQTPDAPAVTPIDFKLISYTKQGGLANSMLNITVYADGRLVRDGVESRITPEDRANLNAMLEAVGFLNISGNFTNTGLGADQFRYTLTVDATNGSQTIVTTDGMTPPELAAIYAAIEALA